MIAAFVLSQSTVLTAGPFVIAVASSPKTGRVSQAAALCQSFASWDQFWRCSAFWEAQALKPSLAHCGSGELWGSRSPPQCRCVCLGVTDAQCAPSVYLCGGWPRACGYFFGAPVKDSAEQWVQQGGQQRLKLPNPPECLTAGQGSARRGEPRVSKQHTACFVFLRVCLCIYLL